MRAPGGSGGLPHRQAGGQLPLKSASELDLHLTTLRTTGRGTVVHTHSYAVTTVASLGGDRPARGPTSACSAAATVRVADYAVYDSPELAANMAKALEGRTAALWAPLAPGDNIPLALPRA
ncbi:class II aldolase/adducin family protein [Actinomyces trachealis]|uniref:class II aldolase/adducin family protein n=1 Tax=Actinomyces trachealis TaxID=2763540 RepID=UPI001FD0CDC9|nr:class II aldolase/adducin family protein [Actinomyces trachealis]